MSDDASKRWDADNQRWLFWDGDQWVPSENVSVVRSPQAHKDDARIGGLLLIGGLIAAGAVVVACLFVAVVLVKGAFTPGATFSAKIVSVAPVNPGAVTFLATVTNDGPSASAYECTVTVESSGGAYRGFEVFDSPGVLAAYSSESFAESVIVGGNGAAFVDRSEITCKAN